MKHLKNEKCFFLVVFLSLHSAAQANGIPSRGSCKQLDSENVIFPLPSVTWEGNSAILMSDGEATYTEIYGMRLIMNILNF